MTGSNECWEQKNVKNDNENKHRIRITEEGIFKCLFKIVDFLLIMKLTYDISHSSFQVVISFLTSSNKMLWITLLSF